MWRTYFYGEETDRPWLRGDGKTQLACPKLAAGALDAIAQKPTSKRRNVLVLGDSTDKLWVIGTCAFALREGEGGGDVKLDPSFKAP